MRAMIAIGLMLSLTGCAAQKWFNEYGNAPSAAIGSFEVYDRPAGNRLAVRVQNLVARVGAGDADFRASAETYLRTRGCTVQDGYPLDVGAWEFTYQCPARS